MQFARQLHALLVPQAIESMKEIGQLLHALRFCLVMSATRPAGGFFFCVMSVSSSSRDAGAHGIRLRQGHACIFPRCSGRGKTP